MSALYTAIATADGNGRNGHVRTSDSKLDVQLSFPKEMGGSGAGSNPEQLFAAGYAACFSSALGLIAGQRKIDASEAAVTAEVGLVAGENNAFGLAVTLRVELPESLQGEVGRELVEAAHQVCPYSNATRGNIPVELVVE
ncbi:organic hydroperoxide resistance protein [Cryptosporangium aurantiacum]|uniref:Peroxiredoxin, Ohr subfamily n=1 Tax=Cryptosporangium aurantiacum TaxID=134849 RepID=A0A1M7RFX8_9ACTN|nr:organic hydroperoxide resistance protein [Cryptosporangium aurantiacum]SHN45072.1 peroxiredoxin, Ohr subfamily [Cryptosporangium aurantiacum]